MRAFVRKSEFKPTYPEDFQMIKSYLEERGTINVTDKTLESLYYTFSGKYDASWLTPSTDHDNALNLDAFISFLERIEIRR